MRFLSGTMKYFKGIREHTVTPVDSCLFTLQQPKDNQTVWDLSIDTGKGATVRDRAQFYQLPGGNVSASISTEPLGISALESTIDLKTVNPSPRLRRYSVVILVSTAGGYYTNKLHSLRVQEWNGFGVFAKKTLDLNCR